jgi:hypothetical protein
MNGCMHVSKQGKIRRAYKINKKKEAKKEHKERKDDKIKPNVSPATA